MPRFHYQALNHDQQVVTGDIEAESVSQAITDLEGRGLTVQSIGHAPLPFAAEPSALAEAQEGVEDATGAARRGPIEGDRGQVILQAHIAGLVQHGKTIAPVLRAYAEETPPGRRRRQLHTVIDVLETGDVGRAVSTFPALSDYWVPLLAATTPSCQPDRVLAEFVARSQQTDEFRRQWWLVLAYPTLVACLAAAVVAALSFVVVPTFREIFLDFELELPAFTQLLLTLSESIRSGRLLVIVAALLAIGLVAYSAVRLLSSSLAAALLFPLRLGRSTSIGKLAQFTADLLDSGLNIPDALRVAGLATRRPRLSSAAADLARDIDSRSNSGRPGRQRLLTATLVHAVRAELPLPARTRLLREISQCHADRARARLSWTSGALGPIAICVVGLIVGWTVLALFMPLFDLVTGLS